MSFSERQTIVRNLISGAERQVHHARNGRPTVIAVSRDGTRIVTRSVDDSVRVWDTTQQSDWNGAGGELDELYAVAFSTDGGLAAGGSISGDVWVWDVVSGQRVDLLGGLGSVILSLAFSSDGARLAASLSDTPLHVWDLTSGELLYQTREVERRLRHLAFSSDGSTLWATNEFGEIQTWDAEAGTAINSDHISSRTAQLLAFAPDGTAMAGANTQGVWVADPEGGDERYLADAGGDVRALTYTQSGDHLLAIEGNGSAAMWEVSSGEIVWAAGALSDPKMATFATDDSQFLVTASSGEAAVWDVQTGTRLRSFPVAQNEVAGGTFLPDGDAMLIVQTNSDLLRVPTYSIDDLVDLARARVNVARALTVDQECDFAIRLEGC